jgi:hypothetical protein
MSTHTRALRIVVSFAPLLALFASGVLRAEQGTPAIAEVLPNNDLHPAPEQPLPFSHRTHMRAGAKCQTCHIATSGAEMLLPTSTICMTCHRTIATNRPAIVKLAEFAKSTQPIPWVRVYQVLPGVTWTHRPHVQASVQCETCHGAVPEMDVMAKVTSVTGMAACINCHQGRKASTACTTCHVWPAS